MTKNIHIKALYHQFPRDTNCFLVYCLCSRGSFFGGVPQCNKWIINKYVRLPVDILMHGRCSRFNRKLWIHSTMEGKIYIIKIQYSQPILPPGCCCFVVCVLLFEYSNRRTQSYLSMKAANMAVRRLVALITQMVNTADWVTCYLTARGMQSSASFSSDRPVASTNELALKVRWWWWWWESYVQESSPHTTLLPTTCLCCRILRISVH